MAVAYQPQRGDQEERESKLIRMLKGEEEDALGYAQTEITDQQQESLRRYNGEPYGDEEEGRSQVCTREIQESIQSTLPDLMRVVSSGGNVISIEPTTEEEGKYTQDAADYLYWTFFSDNPGYRNLYAFAFDGLLQRQGYLAVYWRNKEYRAPQTLTGLNIMQVQQLIQDPMVEIIGQDFDQESEAGGITLVVRRTKSPARMEIVAVAPEDMRFSGRRTSIDAGRYIAREHRIMRGDAIRMWPEKAQELKEYSGKGVSDGMTDRSDAVRAERFNDNNDIWQVEANEMATELVIFEEYLHADLDDDDYPELIRAYRCGDLLLEFEEVEENPFGTWTPYPIPHRLVGQSYHDIMADLQRQSTVLTRAGLDAVYQSVVNREAYDKNKVNLDELLATYSGAKIGVDGTPGDAILPLTGGLDTAQTAWQALELVARRVEDRTGITRQARGLDADDLSKEHSGVALDKLQMYADARKELITRHMGDGLAAFFAKMYRLACRNQNEPRQARVGGKYCVFDPRVWNSELRVSINVGGTNRAHALMGLQLIGQEQEKVIEALGPANPVVTVKNRLRYQEELCRLAGHKDAAPFFSETPEGWAPEPPPDPEAAKIQAEMQLQTMKMQQEDAHTRLQYQKDMELAQQQQTDERERNAVTAAKDQREAELAAGKLQLEAERLAFERDKAEAEAQLKLRELELKAAELSVKAQQEKDGQDFELKKMDKDYRNKRKLALDPAKADDMDAEDSGKVRTADAIIALTKELARSPKIKRGKDGRVVGFE